MTELVITQRELGRAIGKEKRTVQRYLNEEESSRTLEKQPELVLKIIDFVQEKACYKTYHHIDNAIFLTFFREYFKSLNQRQEKYDSREQKKKVLQRQLAKFIGITQKTISVWLNPKSDIKLSAEKQYQILNFLVSQNIKKLYHNSHLLEAEFFSNKEFDYLGYFMLSRRERDIKRLFRLMQNREVCSIIDKKMQYYILNTPPALYRIIERQFEASLRFAKILPASIKFLTPADLEDQFEFFEFIEMTEENRKKSIEEVLQSQKKAQIYQQSDSETVLTAPEKFLHEMMIAFLEKATRQEVVMLEHPLSSGDVILQIHQKAIADCQLPGSKKEQIKLANQIQSAFEEIAESEQKRLFSDLWEIVRDIKLNSERKPPQEPKGLSVEFIAKWLCTFPLALQDILIENFPAFSIIIDFLSEKKSVFYPFIKKMQRKDTFSAIQGMEAVAFQGLHHNLTTTYDERDLEPNYFIYDNMYENYQEFEQSFGMYIKLGVLAENTIPALKKQQLQNRMYYDKNKQWFQEKIDKIHWKNLKNLASAMIYGLNFTPDDWYLLGLIHIGMRNNFDAVQKEIIQFLDNAGEIIDFMEEES